ncbi:RING-H2 finger protein ATL52-like [Abrus precatorius]|uniref:RING-type E3 ubiquitin transferase n=1 Tax=Abrus precatorius TaxID=3816 RepID=A0A8B8L2W6_ABRPR|nr:RING-H2 finger protein ATL52-like [Abrus precatorius]
MGSVGNSNPWAPNTALKDCSQGICSIYCPQWCYIIYSPPPPSITLEDDDTDSGFEFSPLIVAVIGILASTFILVTYYTIISRFCRHRGGRSNDPTDQDDGNTEFAHVPSSSNSGLDEALIKSITVFKYTRGGGLVEGNDCSVCLSEFEENESLRLLPKCNHAFHLPCIDTWLKSHSSCPLCRSIISSCPNPAMEPPSTVSINALEYQQRSSDVVVIIQRLECPQQQVLVSFGAQVPPKLPVEEEQINRHDLNCSANQRRVSDIGSST